MRLARGIPSLRSQVLYAAFRRSLARASRGRARVTSFSLQRDHIHLIVEAPHARGLGDAMRGLASGFARRLNGILRRRGQRVFADRYHRHDLKTPREVRNALVYVLQNGAKHERLLAHRELLDPYSSAGYFDGWSSRLPLRRCIPDDPPPVVPATFWLLTTGWRRRGLIDPWERPRNAE
jgi:REP element-mobilizing transposase RayT